MQQLVCSDNTVRLVNGSEAGLCLRLTDSCITQIKAQGPSGTCNESKGEKEDWGQLTCSKIRRHLVCLDIRRPLICSDNTVRLGRAGNPSGGANLAVIHSPRATPHHHARLHLSKKREYLLKGRGRVGFRVQGSGFTVYGLGLELRVLWFRFDRSWFRGVQVS